MLKSDFYYNLPEELIAQHPADRRDQSRLMLLDKASGAIEHKHFCDIADYLNEGDCLILNNTKVIPARIYGTRADTGARVEFLLLKDLGEDCWECLAGPGKKAKPGYRFTFGDLLSAEVKDVLPDGNRVIHFEYSGSFYEILDKVGQMPLPHYIHEELKDNSRYQTVYAEHEGSAAAPTAGLHFTDELLGKIKEKGVRIGYVTLHVGLGTFRPVKEENIEDHLMHSEHYIVPADTAALINETKRNGGRVICVGTTSCRTVESAATDSGIEACEGDTSIFIYPGYKFKCLDALITNFHLPESTLIMLVSALAGKDHVMNAYETAVRERYRFFSFGDAMFIH
ncbi:MAG: tRNA preQ1(34) S-adenosylmethionine ribosyltransferase-isomerase QueA [Acutalibacteraceae bacterium]